MRGCGGRVPGRFRGFFSAFGEPGPSGSSIQVTRARDTPGRHTTYKKHPSALIPTTASTDADPPHRAGATSGSLRNGAGVVARWAAAFVVARRTVGAIVA